MRRRQAVWRLFTALYPPVTWPPSQYARSVSSSARAEVLLPAVCSRMNTWRTRGMRHAAGRLYRASCHYLPTYLHLHCLHFLATFPCRHGAYVLFCSMHTWLFFTVCRACDVGGVLEGGNGRGWFSAHAAVVRASLLCLLLYSHFSPQTCLALFIHQLCYLPVHPVPCPSLLSTALCVSFQCVQDGVKLLRNTEEYCGLSTVFSPHIPAWHWYVLGRLRSTLRCGPTTTYPLS